MPKQFTNPPVGQSVATTDGTPTVVSTFATTPGKAYSVLANIVGVRTDADGEGAAYILAGAFRTDADGTLTQIASTDVIASSEDTGGWDGGLSASGTNIVVTVTGANATDVSWRCDLTILPVGAGFNNT